MTVNNVGSSVESPSKFQSVPIQRPSPWNLALKVLVAGLAIISAVPAAVSAQNTKPICRAQPYGIVALDRGTIQSSWMDAYQMSELNNKFPNYLENFISPGMRAEDDGSAILCCDSNGDLGDYKKQRTVFSKFTSTMALTGIHRDPSYKDKGYEFDYDGISFSIGMDSQKVLGYKKALRYLERTVLRDPLFFDQSNEKILKTIQTTHAILHHLSQSNGFRRVYIVVSDLARTEKSYAYRLRDKGGTYEEWTMLTDWLVKIKNQPDSVNSEPSLELRKIFDKMDMFVPAAPHLIPLKMDNFVATLKEMIANQEDPIQIAAFVHMMIVNIHPFQDGNGRLARAWMNTILTAYGLPSIVFSNRKEYYIAVAREKQIPGSFAKYLRDKEIPWTEQQKIKGHIT